MHKLKFICKFEHGNCMVRLLKKFKFHLEFLSESKNMKHIGWISHQRFKPGLAKTQV